MSKTIYTDFYQVLNIPENASDEEIKKAYRQKMKLYHPDMLEGKSEEEQQIAKKNHLIAQEAYETLSNPSKRKVFDLERKRMQMASSNKIDNQYQNFWTQNAYNDSVFDFFSNFINNNFTNKTYKCYRQNTSKTQNAEFKRRTTNTKNTDTNHSTFTQDKKEDTKKSEPQPDFSEIIQLEKELQTVKKELSDLIKLQGKLHAIHYQIDHPYQNSDIQKKVTENLDYQKAKEYIEKHNQRTSKFITKLFISKKDWNTFFEMKDKVEKIKTQAQEEIRKELLEKAEEIYKVKEETIQKKIAKQKEVSLANEKYQKHPLKFRYEMYKMDFTKKWEMNNENHKKVI